MGRREDLLVSLQLELSGTSFSQRVDLAEPSHSVEALEQLVEKL